MTRVCCHDGISTFTDSMASVCLFCARTCCHVFFRLFLSFSRPDTTESLPKPYTAYTAHPKPYTAYTRKSLPLQPKAWSWSLSAAAGVAEAAAQDPGSWVGSLKAWFFRFRLGVLYGGLIRVRDNGPGLVVKAWSLRG